MAETCGGFTGSLVKELRRIRTQSERVRSEAQRARQQRFSGRWHGSKCFNFTYEVWDRMALITPVEIGPGTG